MKPLVYTVSILGSMTVTPYLILIISDRLLSKSEKDTTAVLWFIIVFAPLLCTVFTIFLLLLFFP